MSSWLTLEPQQFWVNENGIKVIKGKAAQKHRAASFFDLFYDLFFVLSAARLAADFRDGQSNYRLFEYFTEWLPILLNWSFFEGWVNRFLEPKSMFGKTMYFLAMLCQMGVALNLIQCDSEGNVLGSNDAAECRDLAVFLLCSRAVIFIGWLRAAIGLKGNPGRPYAIYMTLVMGLGVVLWFLTVMLVSEPTAFLILWWITIAVDLSLPYIPSMMRWYKDSFLPRHTHLSEERFGLFMILCLGEMVVAAGVTTIGQGVSLYSGVKITKLDRYAASLLITVLAFCIKLLHLDAATAVGSKTVTHALEASKTRGLVWQGLYFIVLTGVLLAGATAELATSHLAVDGFDRIVLALGIGMAIIGSALIQGIHVERRKVHRRAPKTLRIGVQIFGGLVICAFGWLPSHEVPVLLLLLLMDIAVILLVVFAFFARAKKEGYETESAMLLHEHVTGD